MEKFKKIFLLFSIIFTTGCSSTPNSTFNAKAFIESKNTAEKNILTTHKNTDSNCHPNYSGCLKANASDYDCAGGSGNGPYYTGKVEVLGPDVFGLDRDNDGWGCE